VKKLAYTFSIFMAVMLLMSLVYALWSADIMISGTIETGTVEGMWISAESNDGGIDPGYDKDVGSVMFDGLGTDTLIVIVDNTYPCYNVTITAVYEYTGTVPAIVNKTVVTTIDWTPASSYGANDGPVWLNVTHDAPVGRQLHPGDTITVVIELHVEQCAEQDASYAFTLEMELIQWNEYIPPAQQPVTETVRLYPDDGNDTTDRFHRLNSSDLNKLRESDDNRYRTISTWAGSYIECDTLNLSFDDITLPAGASIDSVVLLFEWQRPETVDKARIIVYVGSTVMGTIDLSLPTAGQDHLEIIDLKALGVDTVAEINNLKIRFQATDGKGAYTYHDLAVIEVTYTYMP